MNLDSTDCTLQFTVAGTTYQPFVLHPFEQSEFQTLVSGAGTAAVNGTAQVISLGNGAVYTLAILKGVVMQFGADQYDVDHNDQASTARISAAVARGVM